MTIGEMQDFARTGKTKEADRWISANDELPSKAGDYLVCYSDGSVGVAEWMKGGGWENHSGRPTHWAKLPAVPECYKKETGRTVAERKLIWKLNMARIALGKIWEGVGSGMSYMDLFVIVDEAVCELDRRRDVNE